MSDPYDFFAGSPRRPTPVPLDQLPPPTGPPNPPAAVPQRPPSSGGQAILLMEASLIGIGVAFAALWLLVGLMFAGQLDPLLATVVVGGTACFVVLTAIGRSPLVGWRARWAWLIQGPILALGLVGAAAYVEMMG